MARNLSSTYRFQLHGGFNFDQGAAQADYLQDLGISHVYTSPLDEASDSLHGYDVVDHEKVSEQLGGAEGHARFSKKLGEHNLGQIVDVVPNHMDITARRANRLWWDVLENGPSSRVAHFFDVDFNSRNETLRGKVLVPILGSDRKTAIDQKQITLERDSGEFLVKFYNHEVPASPASMKEYLAAAAAESGSVALAAAAQSFGGKEIPEVPPRVKLAEIFAAEPETAAAVDRHIRAINDEPVDPARTAPTALERILDKQNYKLTFWKDAGEELGYRRFFDVNTLIGLRVEDPLVFGPTHKLVLDWLQRGVIDGVRVDHPDGLRDPEQYTKDLRKAAGPDAYIIAEKILEPGETLPASWPVQGTTGYDTMHNIGRNYVAPQNGKAFDDVYERFTGIKPDYVEEVHANKRKVLRDVLSSEVNKLGQIMMDIADSHESWVPYTKDEAKEAISAIAASFPVYRSYVVPDRQPTDDDKHHIETALADAHRRAQPKDHAMIHLVGDILLGQQRGVLESEFVARFQQFTGPDMAKGVEDTTFYSLPKLLPQNEVGGDPGTFGSSLQALHEFNSRIQATYPTTLVGSSTHDTKRAEDVRARLSLLSERPDEWETFLVNASKLTGSLKDGDKPVAKPDAVTEYMLYQTMVGAWPIEEDRLQAYMLKATREAKRETSWLNPNAEFEERTRTFVSALYKSPEFDAHLESFVKPLIEPGRVNSVSMTMLKGTVPGVPDVYQGTELWDLSLVDPDNRRPVDYAKRRALLADLKTTAPDQVWERQDEGMPKLHTVVEMLSLRNEKPDSYGAKGDYTPMRAEGPLAENVAIFQRAQDVISITPRLIRTRVDPEAAPTSVDIPEGVWINRMSREKVVPGKNDVLDLLKVATVALLERAEGPSEKPRTELPVNPAARLGAKLDVQRPAVEDTPAVEVAARPARPELWQVLRNPRAVGAAPGTPA